MHVKTVLPLFVALLALAACSDEGASDASPADPGLDAAVDQQQEASTEDSSDATADQASQAEAEAAAEAAAEAGPPAELDDVLGIWAKRVTGNAMVTTNTCGNFYLIDFDFKHTRFSKTGPTTLKLEYCKDATCSDVEAGVDKTFEFTAGVAKFSKTDPMKLDPACELTVVDDGTISFETTDYGRFSWKSSLSYKGSGCAPFKDPKMTGDTCEAIAASEIDRVP